MNKDNNKPKVIELLVEDFDGTGIDLISFVDEPAIESDFMYFNKQKEMSFAVSDSEQRIVCGAAMFPDKKIIRVDEDGEPFFVFFSKDTVKKCAELFFKNSNHTKSNINHQFKVDGVTVIESWIVDNPENDKSNHLGFKNIPEGTWMVSFKVDNQKLWEEVIKGGKVKGFSVEGAFTNLFSKTKEVEQPEEDKLFEEIKQLLQSDSQDDEILNELKKKLNT